MSLVISNVSSRLEKCRIRPHRSLFSCSLQHGEEDILRQNDQFLDDDSPLLCKHELLVLGSHIDGQIVPGFKYRIRKNSGSQMLFNGDAMLLEGVGQGYGKRLSFASKDVLCNDNFFWSDSNESGYSFTITAVEVGDEFDAVDRSGATVGKAIVKRISEEQSIIASETKNECHIKYVEIEFACQIDFECGRHVPASASVTKGIAQLYKESGRRAAEVQEIVPVGDSPYVLKQRKIL